MKDGRGSPTPEDWEAQEARRRQIGAEADRQIQLIEEKEEEERQAEEDAEEPTAEEKVTKNFFAKMKPQQASEAKDERCKSEPSSSSREPMAPLVTPDTGVANEPVGPALKCRLVAAVKTEPVENLWENYRRSTDTPHDTRADWGNPNAWQQANALNLDPGRGAHMSGAHSWQTPTTNDTDARWEMHRGYSHAPQAATPPDYQDRIHNSGRNLGWVSWKRDNRSEETYRRWESGPYGTERRAERRRRGGRGNPNEDEEEDW
jgi:hypothetical protein